MCFLRAFTTAFAGTDVDMGTVSSIVSAVVEALSGGTKVAVAFGKISKPLGTVERTVLAERAIEWRGGTQSGDLLVGEGAASVARPHAQLLAKFRLLDDDDRASCTTS